MHSEGLWMELQDWHSTTTRMDTLSSRHASLRARISEHPLYAALHTESNLRVFMEHHVYAVWDFMSLIKSLQMAIAPTSVPWVPPGHAHHVRFINQLVLEEESDHALTDDGSALYASHFESYLQAMKEVGANVCPVSAFVDRVRDEGLDGALESPWIPAPAREFMRFTFEIIEHGRPHLLAAVLAHGREALLPRLFRSLRKGLALQPRHAPHLYGYFARHIELDEQEHGPLVVRMMQDLCEGSPVKQAEAVDVAERALAARLRFWDGIHQALAGC
jgi:hypothetical protein